MENKLHLSALDADDLSVISAAVQDSLVAVRDCAHFPEERRFVLLLNRFRWEDRDAAERARRGYERVQSLLVFEDVLLVKSQGIDRAAAAMVLSLLRVTFSPGPDGTGTVEFILAGDGAIALQVEALDATLRDVSRPYLAPSGRVPTHKE